jgi:hypothetical protein
MSILLSQAEADELIAMPKRPSKDVAYNFPTPGERLIIPLESLDRAEDFLLDISRSRIDLAKISYQNRARVVVVLMRLDLNGPPHRNPDDGLIPCPHLHLYREGYGSKWAFPLPEGRFNSLSDMLQTFSDFMNECNVVEHPTVQQGFF